MSPMASTTRFLKMRALALFTHFLRKFPIATGRVLSSSGLSRAMTREEYMARNASSGALPNAKLSNVWPIGSHTSSGSLAVKDHNSAVDPPVPGPLRVIA